MSDVKEKILMKSETFEIKDYSYLFDKLEGISEKQLQQHNELYEKYVAKFNEVNNKLKNVDFSTANHNYSDYRSLKVELAHNLNGAILHEMYFSNLTADYEEPCQALIDFIEKDFADWNAYIEDLKAAGMSSRAGWAVTGYNYRTGKISNFIIDQHNMHVPAYIKPLLIMDTWEHAFMTDYGTDKKAYIKAFLANANWKAMHKRLNCALETENLLESSTD
ncbi:MAG TPA: Fe-Mn family superoxide dismutase [Candidatus Gastranaerophilales bacterium]|nr:Fe-Mn family superoxide dismutase [Candidatus Gastranaerophilales bacterium]